MTGQVKISETDGQIRIEREGLIFWRSEWLIAAMPVMAWLFAYNFEWGIYQQAGVPSVLFDVSFMRMLVVSVQAATLLAVVAVGASAPMQRMFLKSRGTLALGCICIAVAAYGLHHLRLVMGWETSFRWPMMIVGAGCLVLGLIIGACAKPGGFLDQMWSSGYVRIYLLVAVCLIGGFLAQQLGQYLRRDQTVFAVLERPCGPLIEVFRVHGDAVILVPIEEGPLRTQLASLSSLGEINVRFAGKEEVRHRSGFFGPCVPSTPESLDLRRKH